MKSFTQALTDIEHSLSAKRVDDTETLSVIHARGRVLADDLIAPINVPPSDNSAMDGYAICIDDALSLPARLPISQRIAAGDTSTTSLTRGSAARIFTGASIPVNANCVVMQENCTLDGDTIVINEGVTAEGNIRPRGQDIAMGSTALHKGKLLTAADLGLISSLGFAEIAVTRRVRVAIFSTGDELVAAGQALKHGQIYDSNRLMIEALCTDLGCDISVSAHISDNLQHTQTALLGASECSDVIITCGGVSVGEEDHVKTAVDVIGDLDFWKIKIKPGKPFAFGSIGQSTFIGLPGNPVSAFTTFFFFARCAIRTLQGATNTQLKSVPIKSAFSTQRAQTRDEFVRVRITDKGLEKYPNQSSGALSSVVWADALALVPADTCIKVGDNVTVYPIRSL